MLKKMWTNRIEFYPYIVLWLFWSQAVGSAAIVKNRPGMMTLGLVTVPVVILIILAIIKTYKEVSSGSEISVPFHYAKKDSMEGAKGIYTASAIVLCIILVSTYLHHFQPQVLKVPSNADVTQWTRPAFENTLIYDRMTPEERQTVLKEGIPGVAHFERVAPSPEEQRSLMIKNVSILVLTDLMAIIFSLLCFIHSLKHFGFWLGSSFLLGSFVFTGLTETTFILSGRFLSGILVGPLGMLQGSYWFTRGALWFIEAPVIACFGWYMIAYSCVLIADKIFPKNGLIGRAFVGAMMAFLLDLWLDPAITSPENMAWVWGKGSSGSLMLFGIPLENFLAWFLLIFLFAIFWEKLLIIEEKYGRLKANKIFFATCIIGYLGASLILSISWYGMGLIFSLFGAQNIVYIPQGW